MTYNGNTLIALEEKLCFDSLMMSKVLFRSQRCLCTYPFDEHDLEPRFRLSSVSHSNEKQIISFLKDVKSVISIKIGYEFIAHPKE